MLGEEVETHIQASFHEEAASEVNSSKERELESEEQVALVILLSKNLFRIVIDIHLEIKASAQRKQLAERDTHIQTNSIARGSIVVCEPISMVAHHRFGLVRDVGTEIHVLSKGARSEHRKHSQSQENLFHFYSLLRFSEHKFKLFLTFVKASSRLF